MLSLSQQDTSNREDCYIYPNSCFSYLSDSLNSVNSLNFLSDHAKVGVKARKIKEQECIAVGCVPPARYSTGDLPDRTPRPRTETPHPL